MKILQGVLVDDEDFDYLSRFKWYIEPNGNTHYACIFKKLPNGKRVRVYMHRMVMKKIPYGKEIDHIDGNGLNNRKVNLRIVSHKENSNNTHPKGTVELHVTTAEEDEAERLQWLRKKDLAEIENTARKMRESGAPESFVAEFIADEKKQRGLD